MVQAAHGDLKDEEISNHVNTFLLAGEDTTAITLAFTFRSLAEHPEWQEVTSHSEFEFLPSLF
jgi:cytochrome P450